MAIREYISDEKAPVAFYEAQTWPNGAHCLRYDMPGRISVVQSQKPQQLVRGASGLTAALEPPDHPYIKSPLRYPGGKSRAVKQVMALLPPGLESICSPFVGGASIELAVASQGISVHGYDGFEPLVEFWQTLLEDASRLAALVDKHHPLTRTAFYALQKRYFGIEGRYARAAAFYALNRASYSGTTLSGGMSPGHPRFTPSAVERLRDFHVVGFSVGHADFKESMAAHSNEFLYLDPPYANGMSLYGERGDMHENFDHAALAALLHERDGWILSYNDCALVRSLYPYHRYVKPDWAYGIANKGESNELIVLSRDLAPATGKG